MNQVEQNKHMYVNSTTLELGRFDFNLTLEHKIDDRIYDSILISMSPQHAKAMHNLLSQNLAEYERIFGKINISELV